MLARTGRIVGGAPVDANSGIAPWIVGVMPCDDSFTACGVCGSTSIADGFLISAAHCFDPHKHTSVYLYFNKYTYRFGENYDLLIEPAKYRVFSQKSREKGRKQLKKAKNDQNWPFLTQNDLKLHF